MMKIGKFLCGINMHTLRYDPNAPWHKFMIAGCHNFACQRCGKRFFRIYNQHPHTPPHNPIGRFFNPEKVSQS